MITNQHCQPHYNDPGHIQDTLAPDGNIYSVYVHDVETPYHVPSNKILITCGSRRFLDGRTAVQCKHFEFGGICRHGDRCHFIHAFIEGVRSVHRNEECHGHPTMMPGTRHTVFCIDKPFVVRSESNLVTACSDLMLSKSDMHFEQCRQFQETKLCKLGRACPNAHALQLNMPSDEKEEKPSPPLPITGAHANLPTESIIRRRQGEDESARLPPHKGTTFPVGTRVTLMNVDRMTNDQLKMMLESRHLEIPSSFNRPELIQEMKKVLEALAPGEEIVIFATVPTQRKSTKRTRSENPRGAVTTDATVHSNTSVRLEVERTNDAANDPLASRQAAEAERTPPQGYRFFSI